MSKLGSRLIAAAREGRMIARGKANRATYRVYVPDDVDVRKIRSALKLSQTQFAARFGLPTATIRDWEQNRRKPEGAARVLLQVIKTSRRLFRGRSTLPNAPAQLAPRRRDSADHPAGRQPAGPRFRCRR